MIWIACVVAGQLHAQSVFNVLDSSAFLNGSVVEIDSFYFVSGGVYNPSGTGSVTLSIYDDTGLLSNIDTFSVDGIITTSAKLLSSDSGIKMLNLHNDIPPYDPVTRQFQLTLIDSFLSPSWTNFYGGSDQEVPRDLVELSDSYYLVGTTTSYGAGSSDFYLVKTDVVGNLIWQKTYGGFDKESATDLELCSTNHLLIAGGTNSFTASGDFDFYLVKADTSGNLVWEKNFGSPYNDFGGRVKELPDQSYIVSTAFRDNMDNVIARFIKLDPDGEIIWEKEFPYGSKSNFHTEILLSNDGSILVSGIIKNAGNIPLVRTAKIDPTGNILWVKEYFTRQDIDQYIYDIKPTSDGGYIMCGSAFPVGNNTQHAWLIKTNCNGEDGVQHPVTGAPCDQYDCTLYPIDANFTASATTIDLADGGTINFENNSANTTSRVWNFGDGNMDYTDSLMTHIFTQVGTYEVQLIVFHGMCSDTVTQTIDVINTTGIEDLLLETGMNIYPNPNQGDFTIRFKNAFEGQVNVLDLLGRNYRTIEVTKESLLYQMSNLPKGVYVVELVMKNGRREVKRIEVL